VSRAPHLWGETSLGTSDVPFGDRLVFETDDVRGAEFAMQVQSAAFPGDGTTDHKDIVFSLPLFNLGPDGNLIDAQRPGVKLVFECEYTPSAAAYTVTGASNATPIRVTVSDAITDLVNGELVYLDNVAGNTAANGYFKVANKASLRGSADISAAGLYGGGGTLNGLTLILNVNGAGATTLNLNGATNAASKAALLAAIGVQWADLTATDANDSVGHNLLLTNAGATATIVVGAGTANTALGLTAATYSTKSFELWKWVIGSAATPVAGTGAYTSGGEVVYRLTMEWYFALKQPGSNSEVRPIGGTFNSSGTWNSVVGAYGAFALRDTTNTRNLLAIPDGTGDVTATLGDTGAAVSLLSSAIIYIRGAAASTWKTTAGALNLDGTSGINLKKGNVTVADAGATDANSLTLAAGKSLAGAAGAGGWDGSVMTGAVTLPKGDATWAGSADKALSVTAAGTGTIGLQTATGAINVGTTNGARTITIGTGGTGLQTVIVGDNAQSNSVTKIQAQAGGLFLQAAFGTITMCGSSQARGLTVSEASSTQMNIGVLGTTVDLLISSTKLGLYGTGPVVQGAVGATLTNNVTAGGTTNTVDNVTAAPVDTDAASLTSTRNAIYQLALKLATLEAKLKLLGAVQT
jgi:hypothetical protein